VTYLASASQYLATWINRANQAWGGSRQWNIGPSFEADATMWHGRADQAYDGGAWGSGNLWSADAHNDPNVWTNRYNEGYAAGVASRPSTSAQSTTAWAGQSAQNWGWVGMGCQLTVPFTGVVLATVRGHLDPGGGDPKATMRLAAAGYGVLVTGPQTAVGTGSPGGECVAVFNGVLAAGTVVYVEGLGTSFSGNRSSVNSGQLWLECGVQ